MQKKHGMWFRQPSLRGQMIGLCVSSVLITLIISLMILVLLVANVLGPFVNHEAEFAMQAVCQTLSGKTQLLEDTLLRICKSPQMEKSASDSRAEQFKALIDIYSDKNIVEPGLPFVEMVYFFDPSAAFDVVSYHELLSNEQERMNRNALAQYLAFQKTGNDVQILSSAPYIQILYTVYDRWADAFGTVIFSVNQDAIYKIMSKTADYQDAFWYLFDKSGKTVLSQSHLQLHSDEKEVLLDTGRGGGFQAKIDGSQYLLFTEFLGMGLRCAIGVPSAQIIRLLYRVAAPYVIGCVLLLLAVALLVFFSVIQRLRPLQEMTLQLQQVAQQNFSVKLPKYACEEFATMSQAFNAMTDTIDHLIHDVYEKKLIAMDSELRLLQSQINPHFMYNVLCSIALMAQMDGNRDIQKMASNFAGLTQARLSSSGDIKIPMAQELQYAKFYAELQQMRFGKKISYEVSVDDEALLQCLIPKLTIEMLVENAIVHGLEPKETAGTVKVLIAQEDPKTLKIVISDDGVGFAGQNGEISLPLPPPEAGSRHNRIALNTVYKMMKHLYGPAYGLRIESYEQIGTTVTMILPREEYTNDKSTDR